MANNLKLFYLLLSIILQAPNANMKDDFLTERLDMVQTQLRVRDITDVRVLKSMETVPRHLFVPEQLITEAYTDSPLPIGYNQTISQPYIVALMAQEALLQPEEVVLEIGTGSGYAAAVLSLLVQKVYSIEYIPELATIAQTRLNTLNYSNVIVKIGDGSIGLKEYAPYDAILVTAGAPVAPKSLKKQLALGGRLIIPVGKDSLQQLMRITRLDEHHYQEEILQGVRFVPLKGQEGWGLS